MLKARSPERTRNELSMIRFEANPFPAEAALRTLWLSAWGKLGLPSFEEILAKSLGHVGAFHQDWLVGFVNIAWDGGAHASSSTLASTPTSAAKGSAPVSLQKRSRSLGIIRLNGFTSTSSRSLLPSTSSAVSDRQQQASYAASLSRSDVGNGLNADIS